MTKFKRIARYDAGKAADGMWFEPEDEMERTHGQFKCAFFEVGSPAWAAASERFENENKVRTTGNGFRTPKKLSKREQVEENDRVFVRSFVELVLLDWRGIEDEDGKEVPYSNKAAIEYFDIHDATAMFLFRKLAAEAANVRNYQPDDQDGELPEGN